MILPCCPIRNGGLPATLISEHLVKGLFVAVSAAERQQLIYPVLQCADFSDQLIELIVGHPVDPLPLA